MQNDLKNTVCVVSVVNLAPLARASDSSSAQPAHTQHFKSGDVKCVLVTADATAYICYRVTTHLKKGDHVGLFFNQMGFLMNPSASDSSSVQPAHTPASRFTQTVAVHLSRRTYQSIGFRKSTPPQHLKLVDYHY